MSLLTAAPVIFSARITGDPQAEIKGTGRFALAGRSLDLDLDCKQASLERFSEHLRSAGIPLVSGLVSVHAAIAY